MIELLAGRETLDAALAAGPDELTPALYQGAIFEQILVDDSSRLDQVTARGLPLEVKFFLGIIEEVGETTLVVEDPDSRQKFNRYQAVLLPRAYSPVVRSEEAYKLLRYEFGDVSWYLGNFLSLCGVSLEGAMSRYINGQGGNSDTLRTVRDFDTAVYKHSTEDMRNEAGRLFFSAAWDFVRVAEKALRYATKRMLLPVFPDAPTPEPLPAARREEIELFAGRLLGSMSLVLQINLDGNLAEAQYNIFSKLEGRRERGMVFGVSGDVR